MEKPFVHRRSVRAHELFEVPGRRFAFALCDKRAAAAVGARQADICRERLSALHEIAARTREADPLRSRLDRPVARVRQSVETQVSGEFEVAHPRLDCPDQLPHSVRSGDVRALERGNLGRRTEGAQPRPGMMEDAAAVHDLRSDRAQRVGEERRDLEGALAQRMLAHVVILPSRGSGSRLVGEPFASKNLLQLTRVVPRYPEQRERLESLAAEPSGSEQWTDGQVRFAFRADDNQRRSIGTQNQHRLFEPRIEAGQPRQVGGMLPVAVDDQVRQSEPVHRGPRVAQSVFVFGNAGLRVEGRGLREPGNLGFNQLHRFPV